MRMLASIMALVSAPGLAATVVVSDTDLSHLPELEHRGYDHLGDRVRIRLEELVEQRKCQLPGQGYKRLDFRMTFAAEFEPDGSLKKVVIPGFDCPEAESILGGAVLEMIEGGDYRPTGRNPYGWYQGQLRFGMVG